MAKIFRKKRFRLFNSSQMGSYLKYAIGEILLLVIGILIAMQINNWNQKAKNRKVINAVFQEIKNDLEDDIKEADRYIVFYQRKDSLTDRVLQNKVTAADYGERTPYFNLIMNRRLMVFNSNGFENLMLHVDKIPPTHSSLTAQIKFLYNRHRNKVEEFQHKTSVIIDDFLKHYANHYDWFSMTEDDHRQQWIDYQLNDPKYKNEVNLYRVITVRNLLLVLKQYKLDAVRTYKNLHETICPEEELPEFISES